MQKPLAPSPAPGTGPTPAKKPTRRCAEVCLELLCVECVRLFHDKQSGPAAAAALEAIGYRVGQQLVERYTRDKPLLGDTLEIIKFVCKDFWQALFKKQVDNLKTNHRGVYVLQRTSYCPPPSPCPHPDMYPNTPSRHLAASRSRAAATPFLCPHADTYPNTRPAPPVHPPPRQGVYVLQDNGFRWLQRLAGPPPPGAGAGADPGREEAARQLALRYLHLPCGLVRGALGHLGVACTVEADPKQLPSCTFTVRIT
ncbi:hypothetical protein HYH03_012480 [Edaphochlamys debaryana]|uniref:Uncharacterized protein n=1 Tax=Edaphochlamys debaryana TaxID=47281 RepID=A0A836BUG1_9CHLO|nr:hypothetical protein HYH03_012480 [Edaphochlamys debaryana]|eukprot:KAG2489042.1 hypothetical protein HYH03_012480 [Edaphochlamys debaryana]